MMDLISSFMNKNLEDFVKSYTSSIFPKHEETEYLSEIEDETEMSPNIKKQSPLIEHKEYSQVTSPRFLSPKSFLNDSVVESIASNSNKTTIDHNININDHTNDDAPTDDETNNKMYCEYGKENFDLSVDILPMITVQNEKNTEDIDTKNTDYAKRPPDPDDQWIQLPNVVHSSINLDETIRNTSKSAVNDSFLSNIAKEIQLLDDELSSMGLLSGNNSMIHIKHKENNQEHTEHSSDIEHDEEEKMDILKHKETPSNPHIDHNQNQEDEENEENIVIIKDKLSLLRKSLLFKKKTIAIPPNEQEEDEKCHDLEIKQNSLSLDLKESENEIYFAHFVDFENQKEKDAYFDPLVSPIKISMKNNIEDYNEAIYHESATKIQSQWKRFQLKTLLVHTFNRHLTQSQQNHLPIAVTDLIASTTHEIVDHAEKLFAVVHNNNNATHPTNPNIGHFWYNQLHFYGSPALDWCTIYSMIESIVLRNLLYGKNSHIVKNIFDTQQILDGIVSSNTAHSDADNVLIEQLTTQLIQLKTKLYQECCGNDIDCNIKQLKLFPKDINIFKPNHPWSKQISPIKPIDNIDTTPINDTKPEFNQIRNRLTLLRKSFSKRGRCAKKVRSSIASSESLYSSINHINDEINNVCNTQRQPYAKVNDDNIDMNIISNKVFRFDDSISDFNIMQRPQTAPDTMTHNHQHSVSGSPPPLYNYRYDFPQTKKPYLKRKTKARMLPQKIDWSYVKPKTVCRLSSTVRASRNANSNRAHCKPNVIDWKKRVSSRVDCNWSSSKYKPNTQNKIKQHRKVRTKNEFDHSYYNANNNKECTINKRGDDKYLYYLKKGNKIGKITRDSAAAQLQDGSGSMILKTKQSYNDEDKEENSSNDDTDYDEYVCEDESHTDNQLKELQQTFAAIEKAMKQRRQQQHL